MGKLTLNDANRLLAQIKQGEWRSDVRCEWDHKPQSGTAYTLKRNGVSLWVGNGIFFLRLSDCGYENKFIEISTALKVYLWFFGVRNFVKSEIKAFNKSDAQRDYQALSSKF